MIWLTKEQIIKLHFELIRETGGTNDLRDEGLLESALAAPFQTYDSIDLFPSVTGKSVRLACGLTQNHPFVDGNKRIGAHALLIVLALNGISLDYTQDELSDIFLKLASEDISFEGLHNWVIAHLSKK